MTTADLQTLLDAEGVEYFTAEELCRLRNPAWAGDRVYTPPRPLWRNIIPALHWADALRSVCGPLAVVSGFRPSAYNRLVGGSPKSQHMAFRAVDLRPADPSQLPLLRQSAIATWQALRRQGHAVGLGVYNGFIHIDIGYKTRQWRG